MAGLSIDTTQVTEVAKQLDAIADRLQKLFDTEKTNLTVVAPGHDEVSTRAASTLNEVHASYDKSAQQGLTEIREIAAALRAHGSSVQALDEDFVK